MWHGQPSHMFGLDYVQYIPVLLRVWEREVTPVSGMPHGTMWSNQERSEEQLRASP